MAKYCNQIAELPLKKNMNTNGKIAWDKKHD